ncbi:hypothetical protein Q3G72_033015 [Acer saccharum]|nr:hypothetical protein Q3G72_033015 [Acer saccharum]
MFSSSKSITLILEGTAQPAHNQQEICPRNFIGKVIRIYQRPVKRTFGIIKRFDKYTGKLAVMFEDGNVEFLDMTKEVWELATL